MIFVVNKETCHPDNVSLLADILEMQAQDELINFLEHREVVRVMFLDKNGETTNEFYEADDWFGQMELTRLKK